MTLDDAEKLAREVTAKYGIDTDKPRGKAENEGTRTLRPLRR